MRIYYDVVDEEKLDPDLEPDVVEAFGMLDYIFGPILGIILLMALYLRYYDSRYSIACAELDLGKMYDLLFNRILIYRLILLAAASLILNFNPGIVSASLYFLIVVALFLWDFIGRRGEDFCDYEDALKRKIVAQVDEILPGVAPQGEGILQNIQQAVGYKNANDLITERLQLIYQVNDIEQLPVAIEKNPSLVALVGQGSLDWQLNPSFDYEDAMGGQYAEYKPARFDQFGALDAMYQAFPVQGLPDAMAGASRPSQASSSGVRERLAQKKKTLSQRSSSGARERLVQKEKTPDFDYEAWEAQTSFQMPQVKPQAKGWFGGWW